MKRRAICIFHPDFDPDTSEAVESAAAVCNGMKQAGQAMVQEMLRDMKAKDPSIDINAGMSIGLAFEYKILKVEQ